MLALQRPSPISLPTTTTTTTTTSSTTSSTPSIPTTSTKRKISLTSLPNELLLEIIPHLSHPSSLTSLSLTTPHLTSFLHTHEKPLIKNILQHNYPPPTTLHLFPSLPPPKSYADLEVLHARLESLADLHENWAEWAGSSEELRWLEGRWKGVFKAGVLLLWRLQDAGGYNFQVAMLNGFSKVGLACLVFFLYAGVRIWRGCGGGGSGGGEGAMENMLGGLGLGKEGECDDAEGLRGDIDLATEELLLHHGPHFFSAAMQGQEWATTALHKEVTGMIERQSLNSDGSPKPPTLTSCVRRAFAAKLGGHIVENLGRMWAILSATGFDDVNGEMLVKIVRGEEVEGGMKRIF